MAPGAMVKLNKIYTRTGDDGMTGLVGGSRVSKSDLRVEAYGAVDEANAAIGMAVAFLENQFLSKLLHKIQNHLFDLGADLATPLDEDEKQGEALRTTAAQVTWLEEKIDLYNQDLPALKSFVLPGGSKVASFLHLARTIIRRAERKVVSLQKAHDEVNPQAMIYLNRLSDLLFVLARYEAIESGSEVLWEPGK